jgi:hypothetical protein
VPPGGFYKTRDQLKSLLEDCADNDNTIFPQVWYEDKDGDGLSTGKSIIACAKPDGYILLPNGPTLIDCDDTNPDATIVQTWYADADGDHHGSPNNLIFSCSRPPGYFAFPELLSVGDCDDNDKDVHPGAIEVCNGKDDNCNGLIDEGFTPQEWVLDKDNDNYYVGDPVTACSSPGGGYVLKGSLKPGDCNDNDPAINPETIWYIDNDHDGYYNTSVVYAPSCTPPGPSFNTTSTKGPDCNDNDPAINPETIWVLDADKDGYYTGDPVTQCTSPGQGYVVKFAQHPGDCNDNDPAINPGTTWFLDTDGDGYNNPATIGFPSCTQPGPNYKLTTKGPDCDDNNAEINPATIWYKDVDNDGYSDGTTITQCARPPAYKLASELNGTNGDCDDGNAALNPMTVWYKDIDNDGYSDGFTVMQCTRPIGYKLPSELIAINGDCDDSKANINPATVWYKDADNDGYSDGNTITQCLRPGGYKLASELIATSGDCDDNNAVLNPATVWYKDADNDGYSDGSKRTQCPRPTGYKLASELAATSGDCDDNNAILNPATVWYKDADNDNYSDGTTKSQCTRPTGYKLATELTATIGDCKDNDPTINPGAAEVCGNGIDDNCNGVIDEKVCYACQNGTNLTTTNITASSAQFNWVSVPNSRQWQIEYKSTAPGSKWTDILLTGNLRKTIVPGLKASTNYQWHIRALCGKIWTDYSTAIAFTTLGSSASGTATIARAEPTPEIADLWVKALPNPSNTNFTITVKGNGQSDVIKMIVVDLYGRTIEERILPNEQTITLGDRYRPGVYIVKFMQGGQTKQLKLIKLSE